MVDKPVISHVSELRSRLIIIFLALIVFFIIGLFFANPVISKLSTDLLPDGVKLVSLAPVEYFYAQLKVALIIGLVLSSPIIFFQVFAFIKPALRRKEKTILWSSLPVFIILLFGGMAFCYFVFLKLALSFLAYLAVSGGVANLWSINRFLGFALWTCLGTGLVFETPLVVFMLAKLGVVDTRQLGRARPYVYVLIFILAGLITPPDVVTQLMLGIPMVILFEISVLVARMFEKKAS
ncbi:hypothetical protein AYK26_07445 [Euryarchaeota archaeon SM23-78]|nr:MAG: hypothetical protein AYK26_07445 [Euryarchaeota archaeon SM23-78]MBW3001266.1 twin-arginine translocase subunit TatC [Candidatus Woesearchaeota archaeon]